MKIISRHSKSRQIGSVIYNFAMAALMILFFWSAMAVATLFDSFTKIRRLISNEQRRSDSTMENERDLAQIDKHHA